MLIVLPLLAACPAKEFDKSKIKLAEVQVKKIANEWYPQWALRNVSKTCPATLLEMAETVASGESDTKDPWGTPFEVKCGPNAPAEAKGGIGVVSAGPDKAPGTADDIKSW
ncbi:MAG TPA: hypothetical protein VIU61_04850 [Kofleriaceae bacterium]